ncbi:aminoglycoside adenylyltransferase domain-containing protein [Clostridium neuense]|uniref:Aminoglycoside adenylyltransferase domain-containing protein n=1 Tax=Clostridium neuense TaxID=1728934 RepID=A0ABW8TE23_9CLOT
MEQSIEIMKNRIVNILLNNNPSIYLYGSIVLEDFKIGWSDIDILCLTETKISVTQAKQLLNLRQELLNEYKNNLYFRSFEGGFLTLETFINDIHDTVVYWGTSGQRITDKYYFDPFSMIELIEHGNLLYGNEVRDRFIYPTKEEIIEAVSKHYEMIRKFAVVTERNLYSAGWLLDIARCIYTLKTGKIISKTKAGKWVLDNNLIPDADIMEKVIKIREEPNRYKNNNEFMNCLGTLGSYVQNFADVLEKEISLAKLE